MDEKEYPGFYQKTELGINCIVIIFLLPESYRLCQLPKQD